MQKQLIRIMVMYITLSNISILSNDWTKNLVTARTEMWYLLQTIGLYINLNL